MKYFLDTEFLEGTQKKWFGNTKPTIDLISIGIVSEDNREYYAISKDFNLKEAWNRYDLEMQSGDMRNHFPGGKKVYWIRENVLKPIFNEWMIEYNGKIVRLGLPIPLESNEFTYKNFKKWLKLKGKTNKKIAEEIKDFTHHWHDLDSLLIQTSNKPINIEFYTYYGVYDWVVFCWLFGKMIDLPKGFPMYSNDLKQTLDEKAKYFFEKSHPNGGELKLRIESLKVHPDYPKQTNEHNALADARWNLKLYQFLNSL